MLQLDGFQAFITVDNTELPQFGIKIDQSNRTVSCWIPSEAGKHFSLIWAPQPGSTPTVIGNGLSYDLFLDGTPYKGYTAVNFGHLTISRISTSPTTMRPIMFGSVEFNDSARPPQNCDGLGEIALEIYDALVVVSDGGAAAVHRSGHDQSVNERLKKMVTHRIKLGEEEPREIGEQKCHKAMRLSKLATFVFKYRSIDILRSFQLAPLDPNAGDKRSAEDTDDDDDDLEVDEARYHVLQMALQSLNRKFAQKGFTPRKKVKRNHPPPPAGTEIVDLTL
ncbi:hypothetical protein Hypma_014840 [Hypsizygus marmoreus]|uniref:DUF7918 domain-containing protein n=1 Tax=Hypsizygus marmoreus TaxID=39966 RepID=A0A369K7P2_HYPMA|nr:hypothetical protein Hypma_014840 [Hypsizygus marmoreus]